MMRELHIGKPYLKEKEHRVRLCADISIGSDKRTLYYEVDNEYAKYLCLERSDAFVVSLLLYAMSNKLDLTWEVPATDRLVYQLRTIFIPVIAKKFSRLFSEIQLTGKLTEEELQKEHWAVATGISGGVDSFYSIIKHLDMPERSQKLTHLMYVSISNHADTEEKLRRDFKCGAKNIREIANDLHLPLVTMYSNEAEFCFKEIVNWGALRFVGMIYALQLLFSVYYFSSGYPYDEITFGDGSENFDSLHFDLFTLMTVSTKSLNFVGTGGETTRADKIRFIEKNEVVQKYLSVCNYRSDCNCSCCDKCMRTMVQLYVNGNLDAFSKVFNLKKFEANKKKYITKMHYRRSEFDMEIINSDQEKILEKSNDRLKATVIRPVYLLWQKMKKSKYIMYVFYKFHLDYRLYGKSMAESIRYSKGIKNE